MIHVVLVDDEALALSVLRQAVDWDRYEMRVDAVFTDPQEAYRYVAKHDVDVLFTDMKMPHMDGSVLIEKLRAIKPAVSFVVMSSYDDYQSVKQAFVQGAFDYILKIDIDSEPMSELLEKLRAKHMRSDSDGEASETVLERMAEDVRLRADRCVAALAVRAQNERALQTCADCLDALAARVPVIYLRLKNTLVILCAQIGLQRCMDALAACLSVEAAAGVCMGISRKGERQYAYQLYQEAQRALCSAEFYEQFGTAFQAGVFTDAMQEKTVIAAKRELYQRVRQVEYSSLEQTFENVLCKARQGRIEKERVLNMIRELIGYLLFLCYADCVAPVELESINWNTCHTISDTESTVAEAIRRLRTDLDGGTPEDLVKSVAKYISQNYSEPLKLSAVAAKFNVSASHLSRIFKREMSVGFNEYVNLLRIDEAKRILLATDRRIADVGVSVGYENNEHFCRVFKQFVGQSPNSYRGMHKE